MDNFILKELTSFQILLTKCTLIKGIYFYKGQIGPVNKCKSVRDLHIDFSRSWNIRKRDFFFGTEFGKLKFNDERNSIFGNLISKKLTSICGNKMPTRCNRSFCCRSFCLLNMFRAPLCPSSGAQEYYTVVAACGISCCDFQVAGLVWS